MPRLLFDAFHHMMPGHRLGKHIAVGGYRTNFGRYTPGDCFHPNGLSYLHADLARRYDLRLLTAPYSSLSLFDADILYVANPDYPLYEGASPYRWTPADVDALWAFLERGGGVLLSVNSFLSRPDFWEENFDHERVSLLFDRLGLRWDPNFMSDDNTIELGKAGPYRVGYGQGGRVIGNTLPAGIEPLLTRDDNIYGSAPASARASSPCSATAASRATAWSASPASTTPSSSGTCSTTSRRAGTTETNRAWDLQTFGHISAAPGKQGMTEDVVRNLRPKATWDIDHHYRHLTWDGAGLKGEGDAIWERLPAPLAALADGSHAAKVNWLRLDSDEPGPALTLDVTIRGNRGSEATDWHVIGRTRSDQLGWSDLLSDVGHAKPLGKVEQVHTVFEMKVVCDAEGKGRAAKWSQGQIVYARSAAAAHYGWEIMLTSRSGVIAPRASTPSV